jgi:hypothetical protein
VRVDPGEQGSFDSLSLSLSLSQRSVRAMLFKEYCEAANVEVVQALLEAETYCPPTPDRGADLLSVPSAVWRDRAHRQAIRLPWSRDGRHSAA